LKSVLTISKLLNILKGDYIFKTGERDCCIYIVLKGRLEVHKKSSNNKHDYVVSTLIPGDHFNEKAFFVDEPHNVSLYASTDVDLIRIDRDKVMILMEQNPQLSNKILWWISRKLTERLTSTTQKYSDSQDRSTDVSDSMEN